MGDRLTVVVGSLGDGGATIERLVSEFGFADSVKFPGAPKYRAYLEAAEGETWRTVAHDTHVEYQSLLKDLVLESEYLGEPA